MLPTLYVIDMWQLLAVCLCLLPHGRNSHPWHYFFFLFYLFLKFLGAFWCLRAVSNKKPKAAGPEHCCSHTDHPFETINMSHMAYLQDVASAPPSSQIPERNAVDLATWSLPLQPGPCSTHSWGVCISSRKQWEAGHEGLQTKSPGCNNCHSRLALIWNRPSPPKAANE